MESTNTSEENERSLPEKNDIEQGKTISGILYDINNYAVKRKGSLNTLQQLCAFKKNYV